MWVPRVWADEMLEQEALRESKPCQVAPRLRPTLILIEAVAESHTGLCSTEPSHLGQIPDRPPARLPLTMPELSNTARGRRMASQRGWE